MTFTATVAAGAEAVTDLGRLLDRRPDRDRITSVTHEGLAVAWAADNRFVSSCDDGDVLVVLDGLLHNLFDAGRSPASLLLERYRERGDDVARDLLGDFVGIVLDRTRRTLLVCRDPLGVRPWYQSTRGRRHSGATEEATLCALPWVDDGVDEAMALAYLATASESRGPTLHRGIVTLAPGSTWTWADGRASVRTHHSWEIRPEPRVSWDEAVGRARDVVTEAVRDRLRAAGSASSELSGGLDSSAVVGTAVLLGDPPLAGRLLFQGRSADERNFSDDVVRHWGVECLSVAPWIPTEEESGAWTAELRRPLPDGNYTMFLSLHRAFVEAGRPVGLTGLGGDDAFVAMPRESRITSAVQQRQGDVLRPLLRTTLRNPARAWRETWRPTLKHLSPRGIPRFPGYIDDEAAAEHHLADHFRRPVRLTGVAAIDERADNLTSGHMTHNLELAALVGDAAGRRSSHPFLDPRVVTAVYGLDPWFPLRGGHYRALQAAAFADRVPPSVRDRRTKAEFSEVVWPQGLTERAVGRITTGPLVQRRWLDLDQFGNILNGAREGRAWAARPLSRAVELDRWLRQRG